MKNFYSIIIPALNEEAYIGNCLDSLKNQDHDDYEIIVVDNGSTDKTKDIAKNFGIIVAEEKERGISRALISGVKKAKGNIFVFTDADTIVPKNWLSEYDKIFQCNPDAIAVGGPFRFYEKRLLAQFFNSVIMPLMNFIFDNLYFKFYPTLSCANMAVKGEAYKKVGGFNPNIMWGQEIELSGRLSQVGKLIFDSSLLVKTSFRRYSGEKSGLRALWRSLSQSMITIYRGVSMHFRKKTFPAQELIRK